MTMCHYGLFSEATVLAWDFQYVVWYPFIIFVDGQKWALETSMDGQLFRLIIIGAGIGVDPTLLFKLDIFSSLEVLPVIKHFLTGSSG